MTVTAGGREFEVARPSLGTLYEVSALVSELSELGIDTTANTLQNIITDTLRVAKYAPVHTAVLAMLILGARRDGYVERVEQKPKTVGRRLSGLVGKREQSVRAGGTVDRFEELKTFLFYNASPSEIQTAIIQILGANAEAPFFLQTTLFLSGTKITAPTTTTTPGQ